MLSLLDVVHIKFNMTMIEWLGILACDQYYLDTKSQQKFTTSAL